MLGGDLDREEDACELSIDGGGDEEEEDEEDEEPIDDSGAAKEPG